jgi:hypothetical protein
MRTTRVVAAAVPVEIAEAIERFDGEPGGKSRFIRQAVIRAVKERQRKRASRQAQGSEPEVAA